MNIVGCVYILQGVYRSKVASIIGIDEKMESLVAKHDKKGIYSILKI